MLSTNHKSQTILIGDGYKVEVWHFFCIRRRWERTKPNSKQGKCRCVFFGFGNYGCSGNHRSQTAQSRRDGLVGGRKIGRL